MAPEELPVRGRVSSLVWGVARQGGQMLLGGLALAVVTVAPDWLPLPGSGLHGGWNGSTVAMKETRTRSVRASRSEAMCARKSTTGGPERQPSSLDQAGRRRDGPLGYAHGPDRRRPCAPAAGAPRRSRGLARRPGPPGRYAPLEHPASRRPGSHPRVARSDHGHSAPGRARISSSSTTTVSSARRGSTTSRRWASSCTPTGEPRLGGGSADSGARPGVRGLRPSSRHGRRRPAQRAELAPASQAWVPGDGSPDGHVDRGRRGVRQRDLALAQADRRQEGDTAPSKPVRHFSVSRQARATQSSSPL